MSTFRRALWAALLGLGLQPNFPRFDRNPNTGHGFGEDAELRKATQTIHHSAQYPSHITLPLIP